MNARRKKNIVEPRSFLQKSPKYYTFHLTQKMLGNEQMNFTRSQMWTKASNLTHFVNLRNRMNT